MGWFARNFGLTPVAMASPVPPAPADMLGAATLPAPVYPDAVALIMEFEGFRGAAYLCPAGVWTIGYGTTRWPNGSPVKRGQTITQPEAATLAALQISDFAADVDVVVKVPVTARERGALVALAYNIGMGAFRGSSLLRLLNGGRKEAAAAQFDAWVRGGGKVLPGLVRRRAAERRMFEG